MPYAVLEQKIKSLPQEYYVQVENFVQFMLYEASRKKIPNFKQVNFRKTGKSLFRNSRKRADSFMQYNLRIMERIDKK